MKKVYFEKGPDRLVMGTIEFIKGVPKEVEDSIADALVKKGHFKYLFETSDYSDIEVIEKKKVVTKGGK